MKTMETVRSADGTTIAFDVAGSGAPTVFVNGALSSRSSAGALIPYLAPLRTVYTYDRRGRGDSGNTTPYAVGREVEDLAAVIDVAGGSADVYAHSGGAFLALEAVRSGISVPRLILHEPPFIVTDDRARPGADLADRLERLVGQGDRAGAVRLFYTEGVALPEESIDRMAAGPGWPAQLAMAHTLPYDMRITGTCELVADRLRAVDMPTLVVQGGSSPAWMKAGTRALADTLPNARLVVLEGQGHQSAADVIAPELIRFLVG